MNFFYQSVENHLYRFVPFFLLLWEFVPQFVPLFLHFIKNCHLNITIIKITAMHSCINNKLTNSSRWNFINILPI